MKTFILIISFAVCFSCCVKVVMAGANPAAKLTSPKSEDQQAAIYAIKARRKATIDGLIKIVKKRVQANQFFGAMESAVRLLGSLRAKEAVPVLIENIDFQPPVIRFEYGIIVPPCVQALIEIGVPAAKTIWMKHLPASTKKKLPFYLEVMKGTWGKEICMFLVREKLKVKMPDKERANLVFALKYFQDGKKAPWVRR